MTDHGFIGRTIVGVEDDDWPWLLRLDDGTAVEFDITDYGDTVTLTHLTDEVIEQRIRDEIRRRRQVEINRRAAEQNREHIRKHIAEMREKLGPEVFEKWRRETYPTMEETLKDVWTSPLIQEQFAGPSPFEEMDQ